MNPCCDWPAVDCREWPEPFDAFPVEPAFEVRPDLVKLVPADDWLRVDRQWPAMVAAKRAALLGGAGRTAAANIALASTCDDRVEQRRLAAVARAITKLAATDAGLHLGIRPIGPGIAVDFGAAGYRVETIAGDVRWMPVRPEAASLQEATAGTSGALSLLGALALSLQEDLVLMEQGDDGATRAAVFHVSFPSAWNPASKVGQDLLALHGPVADNAALQAAAGRLGSAILNRGPFVRWVWTITEDARWRAWPPSRSGGAEDGPGAGAAGCAPIYFRLERQTTMPLGNGYGLFLIRVQVRALAGALAAEGRLGLLQASLRSMSDGMVRYKNLAGLRRLLLASPEDVAQLLARQAPSVLQC